jgi:Tfp pilus assembly protein PilN
MTQVNLLPADVRERQRIRRLTAAVVLGIGAVVALLFFVFVLQAARLSNADQKLKAQQAVNAELQARVGQLQQFQQLKLTLAARQALTAQALSGRVLWSGVLRDISMVIPPEMWLTGMTGQLNEGTTATAPTAPAPSPSPSPSTGASPAAGGVTPPPVTSPAVIGTIQFQGMAADYPTVALWLSRLELITGWANPWATNATKIEDPATNTQKIQFSGSVDLTTEATQQGRSR